MLHPYSCLHLVDILSARPAGAVGIPLKVGGIYFNLDGVIHKRIDEYGRKCSLPLALCIERRYAHQPVHPALGLQIAEGIVPLELYRG